MARQFRPNAKHVEPAHTPAPERHLVLLAMLVPGQL